MERPIQWVLIQPPPSFQDCQHLSPSFICVCFIFMWFFFGAVAFWRPWHFSLPHRQLCIIRLKRHRISIMEAFQTLISLPLIGVDISRILRVFCQASTYLQFYVATFSWRAHSLDVGSLVKSIFLTNASNTVGSSTGSHNQFLHTLIVKGSVSVFSLENISTPSVDGALIYRGSGDVRNKSPVLHQPVLHSLVRGRKAGWSQAEANFISCKHLSVHDPAWDWPSVCEGLQICMFSADSLLMGSVRYRRHQLWPLGLHPVSEKGKRQHKAHTLCL